MLPHLHNGWQVDQAILSEEDRVVVIRFGHDWDPTCMKMDEVLYSIAEKVNRSCLLVLSSVFPMDCVSLGFCCCPSSRRQQESCVVSLPRVSAKDCPDVCSVLGGEKSIADVRKSRQLPVNNPSLNERRHSGRNTARWWGFCGSRGCSTLTLQWKCVVPSGFPLNNLKSCSHFGS